MGGGDGRGVVRAHVGVRLGAARRRARHARVRRRHAGGLGRRLHHALLHRQLHRRLHAARRLPPRIDIAYSFSEVIARI